MDLEIIRHSLSHVLASAVKNKFKNVKFAIGPAISNGFYYDFDLEESISQEDLFKIEGEMKRLIAMNLPFERKEISKEEALKLFADQPYKIELIMEHVNEQISVYQLGDFVDLCRGPHIASTADLKDCAFKLVSVNGAYWRGNEKNKMLQRVYAYAFANKDELDAYIKEVEEAKLRDHNKIGRELEYFTTVNYVGKGLPILLPNGAKVIQILSRYVEDEEARRGYLLTKTPYMAKNDLYKISGHWYHYRDSMFVLGEEGKDEEVFCLRPMTCPFQYQVFLNKPRSYRELPMRLGETSTLFRKEASGEMHGLIRVRQFTLAEGHIVCTPEQLEEEFSQSLDLAKHMLKVIGLDGDIKYRFSKWDPNNKDKYEGSADEWERVQTAMREILNKLEINYYEAEGEAAFYGPKLDLQIKNVHGKEDTLITIQIDFQAAAKFGMEYTDKDGQKKFPYIIHRSSIGCYERTLALILEKYAGALPFWIAPTQVGIVPVKSDFDSYAKEVAQVLTNAGIRVETNFSNEGMGAKVFGFKKAKVPYAIVLGGREMENKTVSIKTRDGVQINGISLDDFVKLCVKQNNEKTIKLIDEI